MVIANSNGTFDLHEKVEEIHECQLPRRVSKMMYDNGEDTATVDSLELMRHQYENQLINET